jgi:V8-like Glu-specific endopeptidase
MRLTTASYVAHGFTLGGIIALLNTAGCFTTPENPSPETDNSVDELVAHPAPMADFRDDKGMTWKHIGPVQYVNAKNAPVDDKGADIDMTTMTEMELVEHLRPRMEYGGHEYRLGDADALQLAKTVRRELVAPSTSGSAGEVPPDVRAAQDVLETDPKLGHDTNSIYDGESRININYAATTYPYNNHAQMTGGGHTCTAFKLVNHNTAVTAAHCVHDGSNWLTRKTLTFQAGSSRPLGTLPANCYDITVPGCWSGDNTSCDYAVLRLHSNTAWCNLADYNVGYLGWNDVSSGVSDIKAFLSGYPSDRPLPAGWVYPSLAYDYRENGWTSWPTYPDRVWYYNDSTGGQSGTALVSFWSDSSWRVRAIHHGEFCGFSCSGDGRRMTSDLFSWLSSNAGY